MLLDRHLNKSKLFERDSIYKIRQSSSPIIHLTNIHNKYIFLCNNQSFLFALSTLPCHINKSLSFLLIHLNILVHIYFFFPHWNQAACLDARHVLFPLKSSFDQLLSFRETEGDFLYQLLARWDLGCQVTHSLPTGRGSPYQLIKRGFFLEQGILITPRTLALNLTKHKPNLVCCPELSHKHKPNLCCAILYLLQIIPRSGRANCCDVFIIVRFTLRSRKSESCIPQNLGYQPHISFFYRGAYLRIHNHARFNCALIVLETRPLIRTLLWCCSVIPVDQLVMCLRASYFPAWPVLYNPPPSVTPHSSVPRLVKAAPVSPHSYSFLSLFFFPVGTGEHIHFSFSCLFFSSSHIIN
ncbi:hypothetical protein VP01_2581g2 [Puccinia sorghi]|uniref:Uncharacterized protein n=1 Tax=Puccinia sorghi TaxID=27349 RepID=A0A0L6V4V0_9BASI|nr:hypothetical protein VP01_2581g2 [Puccinia sorghi]